MEVTYYEQKTLLAIPVPYPLVHRCHCGLLIPMAAGMMGAAYASSEKEERRPRGFIVLALAVVVLVITFAFNL